MQHRSWNPKAFFRNLTRDATGALAAYLGISLIPDAGDPEPDAAYRQWQAIPKEQRKQLEARIGLVNDLCSTHARAYLDELAQALWDDARRKESLDWSAQDLAVRLFVSAPAQFASCHQRYMVDMMDHLTEYRGKRPVKIQASARAKKAMAEAMKAHFREHAGGARCHVEDFEAPDKFALFIYHEDEVTTIQRFDDENQLVPDWQRPIVQVAAIFYPEHCTLLVKAPKKPDREMLRDTFAKIFVQDPDFFEDVSAVPKFDFTSLSREDLSFSTKPADKILAVSVVKLVLKATHQDVKRLIFEFVPGLTMEGVSARLQERGISLAAAAIDAVQLRFTFEGTGRGKDRTASLYLPNRSNLNDTPRDRLIRRYLKEWRIDASHSAFALAAPPHKAA